jgi:hypothetical protein
MEVETFDSKGYFRRFLEQGEESKPDLMTTKMRHVRKFEIAELYDKPFPSWVMSVFWLSAWLFCLMFWWGVIRLMLSH